jgi:acyl carrier protein
MQNPIIPITHIIPIMNRTEIKEKVKEFLVEELEIDENKIFDEALLKEDVGIDSLDYVDIVVIVMRVFGFKIQQGDLKEVKTLNDFYDYIEQKLAGNDLR